MLYTKILVCSYDDWMNLTKLNDGLIQEYKPEVLEVAEEIAALIKKYVPEHVLGDYKMANRLAAMPVLDSLIDALIDKGLSREEAYDTVQPVAMRAMAERADYQELLAENEKVMSLLSREELDSCFTLEYYLKNVDYIFQRAGIIE